MKSFDLSNQNNSESTQRSQLGAEVHPLRRARQLRNLTIAELAAATRVSIRMIQYVEHGHTAGVNTRKKLCTYFGVRPDELGLLKHVQEHK